MKSKYDKKPVNEREYHELMQPLIDLRKRSLFALRQSTINQFVDAIFFARSFCEVANREIDGLDDFVSVVKKKAQLVKSGAEVAFTHDELLNHGWDKRYWKAKNGYAKKSELWKSEAIWFSPHCHKAAGLF